MHHRLPSATAFSLLANKMSFVVTGEISGSQNPTILRNCGFQIKERSTTLRACNCKSSEFLPWHIQFLNVFPK